MANTETKTRRDLAKILAQTNTLESLLADEKTAAASRPNISGWGVGEHVEHLLIADRGTLEAIDRMLTGSLDSGGSPTAAGRLILAVGRIKRGIGKSPAPVRPRGTDLATVRDMLTNIRSSLDALGNQTEAITACRATAPHPVFGHLRPAQWLRFIDFHHRHHLRIIDDILAR